MAKRFIYVSIGVLCLLAAYQLGAESARADWRPEAGGTCVGGAHLFWYSTAGEAWLIDGSGWHRDAGRDLPIPASQVRFLFMDGGQGCLITTSDEGWYWQTGNWTNQGPFPSGPVALDQESWGKVKAKHR